MKRIVILVLITLLILPGCSSEKENNVIFDAIVEEVNDGGVLVTTEDEVGFDKASVTYDENLVIDFELAVGQSLIIEILPEIRESYPVGVTAVRIELMEEDISMDNSYKKITPEEAKNMMAEDDVIILDVRTAEEYAEVHIEGALLIPDSELAAQASEKLPDKDQTILVYCRSGRRSEASARALVDMGYSAVYDFGGIIDWPYETVTGN